MSALVLVMDNCYINKIEPLEDCIKDSSLALVADANLTELPLLSMTIVPITAETFRHIILITSFKKLKEVQNAPVDLFLIIVMPEGSNYLKCMVIFMTKDLVIRPCRSYP